jgi:hypothetical protein
VVVVVFSVAGDHCRDKTTVDEMGDPKSDDWLPEGWRVEVKVRNSGKKDKVIGNCLILSSLLLTQDLVFLCWLFLF